MQFRKCDRGKAYRFWKQMHHLSDDTWKRLKSCGVQVNNQMKNPNKEFKSYGSKSTLKVSFDSSIMVISQVKMVTFYAVKDSSKIYLENIPQSSSEC